MAKRVPKQPLTQAEVVERNLKLQAAFNQYLFDHPEMQDQLPEQFRLVILPQDDPDLSLANLQLLNTRSKRDVPVVIVLMRSKGQPSVSQLQPDVFLPLPAAA